MDSALKRDLERAAADTGLYGEAADIALAEEPATAPVLIDPIRDVRPARAPAPVAERVTSAVPPAIPARVAEPPAVAMKPAAGGSESCRTPGVTEQRRCLMSHLAASDRELNGVYQSLISEMRNRESAGPAAVAQLRQSQRAWLVYRDRECRQRNRGTEGPLWAPVRAACLGEFSERRAGELRAAMRTLQAR